MEIQINESTLSMDLLGVSGTVEKEDFAGTGLRLMDTMWAEFAKFPNLDHSGTLVWVYLGEGRLFTGVEQSKLTVAQGALNPLQIELPRYAAHLHRGPYDSLKDVWNEMIAELKSRGESLRFPSLEIYDACSTENDVPRTRVLLGLGVAPQSAAENT